MGGWPEWGSLLGLVVALVGVTPGCGRLHYEPIGAEDRPLDAGPGGNPDRDGALDAALVDSGTDGGVLPDCPAGYVAVPALLGYTESPFCVMKYEAKAVRVADEAVFQSGCDVDGDPSTSEDEACEPNWHLLLPGPIEPRPLPEGLPWSRIRLDEAVAVCQSLGPGYDLLTNDEWQSVARNVERVASNWQEGVVGGTSAGNGGTDANRLNRGHADQTPARIPAHPNDDWGCFGTGQEVDPDNDGTCPGGWDQEQRTHRLSTGEVLWDLSGNCWELVKDRNSMPFGPDAALASVDGTSHPMEIALSGGTTTTPRNAKDQFGPAGDYSSLTAIGRGGIGFAFLEMVGGGVVRGGRWTATTRAGVFYVRLINGPGTSNGDLSFRCAFHP